MELQTLKTALKSEHDTYLRKCETVKEFYKFWDKQVPVEKYPGHHCWKIKGKIHIATSISLISYTIVLTPVAYGKTIIKQF